MLEHKQLGKNSPWGNIVAEEFNWFREDLIDQLANIPTLKEVYLTGGEPFMVKGLDKFIDKLDRNVQLRFNTNGTLTNNKLLNLLSEFNTVNLAFSIDGIGKVNDYIRYGSDWGTIENNLHVSATYGLNVSITPTIQIYNYPYIQQLWDYCDRYNIPHYDTILINPTHFDIKNMPISMREKYALPKHTEYLKNSLINQSEVDKFVTMTKTLDQHRNIDICEYLPLVAEHYDFS
jgi:MoaA/NifB/PqqE/SkfB family radical SAM enzyme